MHFDVLKHDFNCFSQSWKFSHDDLDEVRNMDYIETEFGLDLME